MADWLVKALIIVFLLIPLGVFTGGFALGVCYLQVKDAQAQQERKR